MTKPTYPSPQAELVREAIGLGWIRAEGELSPPRGRVEAEGPVEWFVAAGVLLIGGVVAYNMTR